MKFKINSSLPQDWQASFTAFEQQYGVHLSNKYLQLKDIEIDVKDAIDQSDKANPLGVDIEKSICYTETGISFTADEQMALIAHEIGHIISKTNSEFDCDQIAIENELGNHLKTALVKLRDAVNTTSPSIDPVANYFYSKPITRSRNELDQRINSL